MTDLRFPIGKFQRLESISEKELHERIRDIAETPAKLRAAVAGLTKEQIDTPYRPDGWTVQQVVHHMSDSHLNAYMRCKLALTENEPVIKPYRENLWAELVDARTAPIEISLNLLESLHARWLMVLNQLTPKDAERILVHPDTGVMKLHQLIQLYAWHGRHHVAHITSLRERMGWR